MQCDASFQNWHRDFSKIFLGEGYPDISLKLPIDYLRVMPAPNLTFATTMWYSCASGNDYLVITVPPLVQGGSHDRLQR